MKPNASKSVVAGALACFAAAGLQSSAFAQAPRAHVTPKNWSYEIDSRGNRVAKSNRVINPDGSWREEVRQGNCITVRERSATGEYKETRQCNPDRPR